MFSVKNAPKYLPIIYALRNAIFVVPVVLLYFGDKGISIGDFFLLQGIYWFAIFLLEVPSGYIADIFSRKMVILQGFIFGLIGYICWVIGFGFWWFFVGQVLIAVTVAFLSGTMDAYLYDLLKKEDKQENFHKELSRIETYGNIGLMLSILTGGFIAAVWGNEAPVYFTILAYAFAVILILFFPDVPESRRRVEAGKSKLQDIKEISVSAVKHPHIKWLMLFPAFYGTMTLILMWGLQSVMVAREIPVYLFSIIMGANAFMRTGWSISAGRLLDKFKLSGVIKILVMAIALGCIGASLAMYIPGYAVYIALVFMMIGSASVVLAEIATSTLINHRIESTERATVLSVKSMIGRIMIGIGMISLKPLFDSYGVGEAFIIASLLLLPIFVCAVKLYRMNLSLEVSGKEIT